MHPTANLREPTGSRLLRSTPISFLAFLGLALVAATAARATSPWEAPASYYSGATGTGATLKSQLTSAMSAGHIQRRYGDFRNSAAIHDRDPNNSSNILLAYNRQSVGSNWTSGSTWNREHVWPQSRQPGSASNSTRGNLGDPHALRPANPGVNSSRSNKPFGQAGTTGSNRSLGSYYFPGDADRGDTARILFYSDTRWTSLGLSLTDSFPSGNQMGDLSSLVAWHYLDPPDEFEQRRNHTIYSQAYNPSYYTNNRNAYIDRPEFVWSVYVDQQNDSSLSLAGGTTGSGAASTLDLDFGSVIVGAAAPASQSVTINKSGNDGTYYNVEATGLATSSVEGRYNAFPITTTGGDSASLSVGLNPNTSIPGAYTGQVTIDNLDVTTGGGSGAGANDGDDVISLSLDVLDHATPSFAAGSQSLALNYDFGSIAVGAAAPTFSFDLFNIESTASFTAGLDLDAVLGSGDTSVLTTDLAPFSALAAGGSAGFSASLGTAVAGAFSASYTLQFSDENLPGAASLSSLTLNLMGAVTGAGLLGDVDLDGDIDASDIDLLYANLGSGDALYDLDLDGGVADQQDVDELVSAILMTEYGDANLDGKVDSADFSTVAGGFGNAAGWATGDFSGDGVVGSADFSFISANFGFDNAGAGPAPVPEPATALLTLLAVAAAAKRRR